MGMEMMKLGNEDCIIAYESETKKSNIALIPVKLSMKTLVTALMALLVVILLKDSYLCGDEVCLISSKRKYKELSGKFKFYCGDITNRDFIIIFN